MNNITKRYMRIRTNLEHIEHDFMPQSVNTVSNILSKSENIEFIPLNAFIRCVAERGMSFYQGVMNGSEDTDWGNEQHLFVVDIDNSKNEHPQETVETLISKYKEKGVDVFLIFETFDSTEIHKKYSVVIVSDEPFTDAEQTKHVIDALIKISPQSSASCNSLAKVCLGSNKGAAYKDFVKTPKQNLQKLAQEYIKSNYFAINMQRILEREKENLKKSRYEDSEFHKAIRNFDLASYIAEDTKYKGFREGNVTKFYHCPICNQISSFVISKKYMFYCNNKNCGAKGNIINYIEYTRKVNKKQAGQIFMGIIQGTYTDKLA